MNRPAPLYLSLLLVAALAIGPGTVRPVHGMGGAVEDGAFFSPSLSRIMPYRVYLPPGYDAPLSAGRRYPVLYLLHGHESEEHYRAHTHWTERTDVAALAEPFGMILVFPEGLRSWYTDYHDSEAGTNRFEAYMTRDLIDHIDGTYRTRPERESRAIAGNSMGGNGAVKLAAKHPELFCAAAGLSGIYDLSVAGASAFLEPILPTNLAVVFGSHGENLVYYQGNSAVALAPNFAAPGADGSAHTRLHFISGILDHYLAPAWLVELAGALDALGIPYEAEIHEGDLESAGHNWTYWGSHIGEVLRFVYDAFEAPPARPRRWRYRTVEPAFEVWGWRVHVTRPVLRAWLEVRGVDADGFDLVDEGTTRTLSVTTAPLFVPGDSYGIVATGEDGRVLSEGRERADGAGALRFSLDLEGRDGGSEDAPVSTVHVDIAEDANGDTGEARCGGCALGIPSARGDPLQPVVDVILFLLPIIGLVGLLKRRR